MRPIHALLALLLLFSVVAPALAEDDTLAGSASLGLYNKYIWRGYDLGGDADLLLQPEIALDYAGLSLAIWGNYNEAREKLDEIDLTLAYNHAVSEQITARVGHILYRVADGTDSAELFAGATLAGLPVDVDLDLFYDYDETEAWFLTCGGGKEIEAAEKTTLTLAVNLGLYDFDYLNQGEVSAALDYAASEALTVTPALLFSTPLSQEAKDSGVDDEFVASVTVAYSF